MEGCLSERQLKIQSFLIPLSFGMLWPKLFTDPEVTWSLSSTEGAQDLIETFCGISKSTNALTLHIKSQMSTFYIHCQWRDRRTTMNIITVILKMFIRCRSAFISVYYHHSLEGVVHGFRDTNWLVCYGSFISSRLLL